KADKVFSARQEISGNARFGRRLRIHFLQHFAGHFPDRPIVFLGHRYQGRHRRRGFRPHAVQRLQDGQPYAGIFQIPQGIRQHRDCFLADLTQGLDGHHVDQRDLIFHGRLESRDRVAGVGADVTQGSGGPQLDDRFVISQGRNECGDRFFADGAQGLRDAAAFLGVLVGQPLNEHGNRLRSSGFQGRHRLANRVPVAINQGSCPVARGLAPVSFFVPHQAKDDGAPGRHEQDSSHPRQDDSKLYEPTHLHDRLPLLVPTLLAWEREGKVSGADSYLTTWTLNLTSWVTGDPSLAVAVARIIRSARLPTGASGATLRISFASSL